jgi:hypothetical protein
MRDLTAAASRARRWLIAAAPKSKQARALRMLGLSLCDSICLSKDAPQFAVAYQTFSLPSLPDWVALPRSDLLSLAQAATLGDGRARLPADAEICAQFFGGLALSYARVGDVSVVACLLRMAAHLSLHSAELTTARRFLLDQQHPDGYFGLLAPEFSISAKRARHQDVVLRLTVEVLWAACELSACEQITKREKGAETLTHKRRQKESA